MCVCVFEFVFVCPHKLVARRKSQQNKYRTWQTSIGAICSTNFSKRYPSMTAVQWLKLVRLKVKNISHLMRLLDFVTAELHLIQTLFSFNLIPGSSIIFCLFQKCILLLHKETRKRKWTLIILILIRYASFIIKKTQRTTLRLSLNMFSTGFQLFFYNTVGISNFYM